MAARKTTQAADAARTDGAVRLVVTLKASHPTGRYHRAGREYRRGAPQEVAVSPEEADILMADPHLAVERQEG